MTWRHRFRSSASTFVWLCAGDSAFNLLSFSLSSLKSPLLAVTCVTSMLLWCPDSRILRRWSLSLTSSALLNLKPSRYRDVGQHLTFHLDAVSMWYSECFDWFCYNFTSRMGLSGNWRVSDVVSMVVDSQRSAWAEKGDSSSQQQRLLTLHLYTFPHTVFSSLNQIDEWF